MEFGRGDRGKLSNLVATQCLDTIKPSSLAQKAGLLKGDYVIAVNGVDVASAKHDDVANLIKKSGEFLTLTVVSNVSDDQIHGTNVVRRLMQTSNPSNHQHTHLQQHQQQQDISHFEARMASKYRQDIRSSKTQSGVRQSYLQTEITGSRRATTVPDTSRTFKHMLTSKTAAFEIQKPSVEKSATAKLTIVDGQVSGVDSSKYFDGRGQRTNDNYSVPSVMPLVKNLHQDAISSAADVPQPRPRPPGIAVIRLSRRLANDRVMYHVGPADSETELSPGGPEMIKSSVDERTSQLQSPPDATTNSAQQKSTTQTDNGADTSPEIGILLPYRTDHQTTSSGAPLNGDDSWKQRKARKLARRKITEEQQRSWQMQQLSPPATVT